MEFRRFNARNFVALTVSSIDSKKKRKNGLHTPTPFLSFVSNQRKHFDLQKSTEKSLAKTLINLSLWGLSVQGTRSNNQKQILYPCFSSLSREPNTEFSITQKMIAPSKFNNSVPEWSQTRRIQRASPQPKVGAWPHAPPLGSGRAFRQAL